MIEEPRHVDSHLPPVVSGAEPSSGGGVAFWLGLVVLAAGAVGAWYLVPRLRHAGGEKKPGSAARSVPVVSARARSGDLAIHLDGLGRVIAFNTVVVRNRVDGELVKVAFQEGQVVAAGDLLAEIDPRPFQVQLEQAEGQLEKDQAELRNAKLNLERFRSAKDAISDQQIDTQAASVTQFEGALKVDRAQVDQAKLQLVYGKITAPIGGRIGLRLVDKGNVVRASDATGLAVITQLQPIAVTFNLPEDDLPLILRHPRAGAGLPVEVYDRDLAHRLAAGELLTVDNQIDSDTGTIKLKAVFANADGALFPKQFVNARLLVETKKGAVLVPSAAVQRSPRSTFVYVVHEADAPVARNGISIQPGESWVEQRDVTIGASEGDETAIEKGLAAGEVVVTEGVDKLQDGSKVTTPAAEKAGGQKTSR